MLAENHAPLICIMGPTASGKTQLALALAKKFPCEIISVDSALVYRGLNIGTAKPEASILAEVPHHLIDILDPAENYSVAQFCTDVHRLIVDIRKRQRAPLLVGGTMLYFRALQQGLSSLPPPDAELRTQLTQTLSEKGSEYLHETLKKIDPQAAQRIHAQDTQRIQRALEMYYSTGKTPTQLYQAPIIPEISENFLNIGLIPDDRAQLHLAIAQRFELMLQHGLLEEAKHLFERKDLHEDMPSMRTVGYRQIWPYLRGEISYETMQEKAIAATRQLAKRQLTWLRQWPELHSFNSQDKNIIQSVEDFIFPRMLSRF